MKRAWIGLLVVLIGLLAITQASRLARDVQVARAGKLLRTALVMRDQAGDLPFGAGTPGMYTLGRASGTRGEAPKGAAGSLVNISGDRLSGVAGAERLAGIALGTAGRTNAAEQILAAASPATDPFAALALGNVLDAQGKRAAAQAAWQPFDEDRALSYQLYRKGTGMTSRNQRAEAEPVLVLATEIDPSNANALHALGGYYWSTDQPKAAELYRRALQAGGLAPFFERIATARVAVVDGRLEEAAAALEEAVTLQPDHAEANQLLGTVLNRLGRLPEAIPALQTAANSSPTAYWPLIELGKIYLETNDYPEAIQILTTAASRRTDQPQAFALLAQALAGNGQLQQAASAWQQAVTLAPNNVSYRNQLGDVLQQAGRRDEAVAAYREALNLAPDNKHAQQALDNLGVGQ
jgi:tetratricopeptide (TPR) repeat protein